MELRGLRRRVAPPKPKMDLERAEELRRRYAAGESGPELSQAYGVGLRAVYNVLHGRTHRPRFEIELTSDDFARLQAWARERGVQPREMVLEVFLTGLNRTQ